MKLRKLFAGVAAAATLLGGMAFGATTANAAEAATFGDATITVTTTDADQFKNSANDNGLRAFTYVKVASYVTDGNTGVELQGAVTGDAVDSAFEAIGYNAANDTYNNRWIWLGNQKLTAVQSKDFAAKLASLATTPVTPTASTDGKSLTFDFTAEGAGLYLIVDQSTGNIVVKDDADSTVTWNTIDPLLVGTEITTSDPAVTNASGTVLTLGEGAVALKSTRTEVFKANVVTWQKVDKSYKGISGATFNVYEGTDTTAGKELKFVGSNGTYNLPYTGETGTVSDLTSDAQGNFTLKGLERGVTYTVVEKSAPTGYNSNFLGKFTVTVADDGTLTYAGTDQWGLAADHNGAFKVVNVKNITELPLTGAAGTALFSVIGLLIAGAAVTVFAKSRSTKRALNA